MSAKATSRQQTGKSNKADTPGATSSADKTKASNKASTAEKADIVTGPESTTGKGIAREAKGNRDDQFYRIQVRAYYLWEQAGKPDGDAARERHWFAAERELSAG